MTELLSKQQEPSSTSSTPPSSNKSRSTTKLFKVKLERDDGLPLFNFNHPSPLHLTLHSQQNSEPTSQSFPYRQPKLTMGTDIIRFCPITGWHIKKWPRQDDFGDRYWACKVEHEEDSGGVWIGKVKSAYEENGKERREVREKGRVYRKFLYPRSRVDEELLAEERKRMDTWNWVSGSRIEGVDMDLPVSPRGTNIHY